MLVVFEGINGSGKTTLITKVSKHLACLHRITREPYTKRYGGQHISTVEQATADRAIHTNMLGNFTGKQVYLCDRYYHSTAVYQGGDRWIQVLKEQERLFPRPDIVVWLDVSPVVASIRKPGDERTRGKIEWAASKRYKEVMNYIGVERYDGNFKRLLERITAASMAITSPKDNHHRL